MSARYSNFSGASARPAAGLEEFLGWARQELRPVMKRMLDICEQQQILQPQAAYGYWKAAGEGDDLVVFAEDGKTEITRFTLPAPGAGEWRVHRRLLPRHRCGGTRRGCLPGGHHGAEGQRRRA